MKKLLIAGLFVILAPALALPQQLESIESKIEEIKTQIERQMAAVEIAREKADMRLDLAKMRVEDELRVAEEELERQIASLEALRETLPLKAQDTEEAIIRMQDDWHSTVSGAFDDIKKQIRGAEDLMDRLRGLREKITGIRSNMQTGELPFAADPPATGGAEPAAPAAPTPDPPSQPTCPYAKPVGPQAQVTPDLQPQPQPSSGG